MPRPSGHPTGHVRPPSRPGLPSPAVQAWLSRRVAATLLLMALGEAGLRFGVAIMPAGRRRDATEAAIGAMLRADFAGRILPFDGAAARAYATIAVTRHPTGRPVGAMDAQIAAIARSRNMAVATRVTRDFADAGVDVVDPGSDVVLQYPIRRVI